MTRKRVVVLGWSLLAVGLALVLTGVGVKLAPVAKTFGTPLGSVRISCGTPWVPPAHTDFAEQPDIQTALAGMPEARRDIALAVWHVECGTALAQAGAPAILLFQISVLPLGAGAVILTVALWRRRRTGDALPGPTAQRRRSSSNTPSDYQAQCPGRKVFLT